MIVVIIKERTAHVRVFIVVSSAVLKRACDHIGDKTRGLIIIFLLPTLTQYMMMCTTYFQRVLQRIRFKNSIIIKYAKMKKCSLHAYLPGVCYLSLTTPMLMTSLVSLFLCLVGSSFDVPKSNKYL